MDFVLLNSKLEQIYIMEEYESNIWTDRYSDAGDFEIYTAVSDAVLSILRSNEELYLWNSDSEHLMVVEDYSIETKYDEGDKLLITGRSIESILDRRIIWNPIKFSGPLDEGIKRILFENVISPSDERRRIPNIFYKDSEDPKIKVMTTDIDLYGETVYDIVREICKRHKIGFKLIMDENDRFVFSLYIGEDRSYDQTDNTYVLFSTAFENLGSSNFIHKTSEYKNVTKIVVARDDQFNPTREIELTLTEDTGLRRREMFTDPGAMEESDAYFIDKGRDDLRENREVTAFEGMIEATKTFVYGRDFFIGDIVQIENQYGMETKSRVTELVMHQEADVIEIYPTFEAV